MSAIGATPVGATSIAVVLGGPSAEHDVSLVSGRAIAGALASIGHPVAAWLITLDGGWWELPAAALDGALAPSAYDEPASLGARGPLSAAQALDGLARSEPPPVVFLALHGPFGEDGTIQALCEAAGLVYTGSGVAASALGMDKARFKRLAHGLGLPGVPWRELTAGEVAADEAGTLDAVIAFARNLPDPRLIAKPARLGSSVGMTIVHQPEDRTALLAALREAFRFDERILVEAYLAHARELETGVLGNGPEDLAVFGPGEVFPGREFYNYAAKYSPGVSRTTTRPELAPAIRGQVRSVAREAFLSVGAEGFARVDFLLQGDALYVSEINTIPGFTPISLFPLLCAESGLEFAGVCERIVQLALERAARRPRRTLTRGDLP